MKGYNKASHRQVIKASFAFMVLYMIQLFLRVFREKNSKSNVVIESTYEASEFEKSAWNLEYSAENIERKGGDSCKVGWPGPECPKVPEGGISDDERARMVDTLHSALSSENSCRFSFQSCSFGSIKQHGLGRCAVVGLSDTLGSFGSLIDSHDTVFRIGFLPLERYKHRSGVKTNYTLCRGFKKKTKTVF